MGDRVLKVDHAGEHGAVNIYRGQILLSRIRAPRIVAELREFQAHELRHRATFGAELQRRGRHRCRELSTLRRRWLRSWSNHWIARAGRGCGDDRGRRTSCLAPSACAIGAPSRGRPSGARRSAFYCPGGTRASRPLRVGGSPRCILAAPSDARSQRVNGGCHLARHVFMTELADFSLNADARWRPLRGRAVAGQFRR